MSSIPMPTAKASSDVIEAGNGKGSSATWHAPSSSMKSESASSGAKITRDSRW